MLSELERYKSALHQAIMEIEDIDMSGTIMAKARIARVEFELNPPPEMEEVEVAQWAAMGAGGNVSSVFDSVEELKDSYPATPDSEIVKLSGPYLRIKPKRVERSVSVEGVNVDGDGDPWLRNNGPFRDDPETHGKTGTLTLTWTE